MGKGGGYLCVTLLQGKSISSANTFFFLTFYIHISEEDTIHYHLTIFSHVFFTFLGIFLIKATPSMHYPLTYYYDADKRKSKDRRIFFMYHHL